jgi:Na+/proline symporter
MEPFRQPIILGALVVYLVLCVAVGIWAMRRTKSAGDFFVAGRSLGPAVVGLAIFSSTMSGFGFVGGPGMVYSSGISSLWMCVTSPLGLALGFYLVAKRIRIVAELRDTVSLPDVVAARYDSDAARFLMAVTIILGVMGYMATQILAMAIVLKTLLSSTALFADISLITCVLLSTAVLLFYSVTGGIIASVYTDLIQGSVMVVAGLMAALLWISIGLIMRSVVVAGMADPLSAPDQAAAAFLSIFAHPLLAGIVFAGLFAAIMSTADSFLNIGAAAIIHDIPRAIRGRTLQNELFWARWATFGLCVIAIAFALFSYYINNRLVALLGAFGWGTFAAAIVPVVLIGLNWQRATKEAAIASIVASLLINFLVEMSDFAIPYGLPGGFLALASSMTIFIVVSLLTPQGVLQPDIRSAMEL